MKVKEMSKEELYRKQMLLNLHVQKLEHKYRCKKFKETLNTNWEKINEERATNNLPKISNQSQRDAYIGIKIEKERYDYKQAEAKALALNTYLKNGISEGVDMNE